MKKRILVIEDEENLLMTLVDRLEKEGYSIIAEIDGNIGFQVALNKEYDLLILDIMLPGKDGFHIASELRNNENKKPILVLTAKSQIEDKILGFKLGVDDYLCKPFEMKELLARIEALLRRNQLSSKKSSELTLDIENAFIYNDGKRIPLLSQEIKLLTYFYDHEGEVILRSTLLASVWGYDSNMSTRTVDVHIARLRQKMGDSNDVPQYIQTVRGKGYKFTAP